MSIEAYEGMPVTYQGLVIESTTRCNARCKMCYQSAGPKGSDILGAGALTVAEISKIAADALTIPTLEPRFHLAGGEAFLNIQDCLELFAMARETGYTEISTTTNAYWAKNLADAHAVCAQARSAGLLNMEISWDYWHQPFVSPEAVSNCLEAAAANQIRTNLRVLATKSHSAGEALALLRPSALECATEISSGPVFPTGRAAKELPPEDIYYTGTADGSCHGVLHLTVNGKGNVYPCCAGADQTDWLKFGNIRENSVAEIAERMNASMLLRMLVFLGPKSFLPILEEAGIDVGDRFSNICHMCWEIFSKPERGRVLHEWFTTREQQAFAQAISEFAVSSGVAPSKLLSPAVAI